MEKLQTAKGWRNPTIIAAVIGALAALLVAIIGLTSKTKPPEKPNTSTKVEASHGVATGGDIRDSTIKIGNSEQPTETHEPPKGN